MTRQRDMECTLTWMGHSTKANGRKISNMAKEKKHGLMEQCMRVITSMVRSMEWGTLSGVMDQSIKGSFTTTTLRVRESTDGQMEGHLEGSGRITRCMAEEYSLGQMVESMKENTLKTKSKVRVLSTGQMEGNTLDNGLMESNMEEERLKQ
jgi:hypothetical protein